MLTTVYETRKNNVFLMLQHYPNRQSFADKIDINYNLLNQYLGKKSQKNIGDKLAQKITTSHKLPDGWLDHPQDEATIRSIINAQLTTDSVADSTNKSPNSLNHSSVDSGDMVKIISLASVLKMTKGEILQVSDNTTQVKEIHFPIPASVKNPVAYIIQGRGYAKPYRNGYVMVCEFTGKPVNGEEVLVFCKDDRIFAGEYLFGNHDYIDIESIDGDRDQIAVSNIARISPVKYFISPSQIS